MEIVLNNKTMETKKWYVGQQVWDKTVSDEAGKIIRINNDIKVEFGDAVRYYTFDGINIHNKFPTLSTKPYEIKMEGFSQEVEEELPKKGQIVWVRDDYDEGWRIAHFSHKEDEFYRASIFWNDETPPCWKFLTTKNPYEEEDREPQIGDMVFAWNEENFLDLTHDIHVSYGTGIKRVYKVGNKVFKYCSLKNPLIK